MKVSLNLMQYVAKHYSNLDIVKVSTEELVKLATERLGGVEEYSELGKHYEGIYVVKVVECVKHPNADKLSLCKVDDGGVVKDVARDEKGYVQVVCGAPNVKAGLLTAWISPGSTIPASYGEKELFVLEARDLRGQVSNGMLASPRELGINDSHAGILEITAEDVGKDLAKPGTNFKKLYGLDDVVISIENKMFTHRPDCFGNLGVAREIAGIQGINFKSPDWYLKPNTTFNVPAKKALELKVTNQAGKLCPRYMAVAIDNVKVGPSSLWLQTTLKRLGVRPINNVVDITNYMMLLTAQPLHAFDYDKVASKGSAHILVRTPKPKEKMTLLDGKEIQPHSEAVLICNPEGPIALGGVMGGGNSEVDEKTTRIILECATFDMYNIRRTSMIHGLFTEAVTRFTKGQPAAQCPAVLAKAVEMFSELAGGTVASEVADANSKDSKIKPVEVSAQFINERLGSNFTNDQIVKILSNVELGVESAAGILKVMPPFWRTDIELPEDVVEEVGRLTGFNKLPMNLPLRRSKPAPKNELVEIKAKARQVLAAAGANEVLTYNFVHGNLLTKVGQKPADAYKIRNAISPDLQYYRQSLIPSLLERIHPNIKAGFDEFALFELSSTHNKPYGENEEKVPTEMDVLALTVTSKNGQGSAYYQAKRYLDFLASRFGVVLTYTPVTEKDVFPVTAPFEVSRSAFVRTKGTDVFWGIIGELKPSVREQLKLPAFTAGFEVGTEGIQEAIKRRGNTYRPLSRYPSSSQDITLQVDEQVSYQQLLECIEETLAKTEYEFELEPVSIYQPKEAATKNITFKLTLTHHEYTLTTAEVTEVMESIAKIANQKLGAKHV